MPRYQVTAPDGRTVVLEGAAPPTDADLEEVFKGLPAKAESPDMMTQEGRDAEFKRSRDEEKKLISNGVRYGGAVLGSEGGLPGSAAAGGSEQLAQWIEGTNDPRAVMQATGMGAIPFGKLGKVAAPAVAGSTNFILNKIADMAYGQNDSTPQEAKQAAIITAITAAMPLLGKAIGKATGNVSPEEAARVASLRMNNANKDAILARMQEQGARVVPSSVNPSMKNKILESVAGIQNVEAGVARENQPLFNAIGRKEASIPANTPINEASLTAARNDIGKDSYTAIRKAGLGDLLDNWRSNATKLKKAESAIDGGKFTVERGKAVDDAQKAFTDAEDALNAAAQKAGVSADVQAAKVAFAKNYDVQDAVLSGTDEVMPAVLSQKLAKVGDAGMTGGLRDIAQFHNAFQRSTKNPAKMATAPGAASAGTGLIAGGGNPAAAAALVGGIPVVRGAIRDHLVSSGYQAKNAVRDYTPSTSADPKVQAIIDRLAVLLGIKQQNAE